MSKDWKIVIFRDHDGSYPVREYLLKLEKGERDRFATRLTILSQKGLQAGYPLSDKLEENLYELRLEKSPHNPRFLYCALLERQLFILHGFSKTGKKTDKVPESEKRIARQRREILIKRFQEAEKQANQNEKQNLKSQKR